MERTNPYIRDNVTTMKVVLEGSRDELWKLISDPVNVAKWFPVACKGKFAKGEKLDFIWSETSQNTFEVLEIKPGSYWEMTWGKGSRVRYALSEKAGKIVFTLTVTYPETEDGKAEQVMELTPWSFVLSNLRSVSVTGTDLRPSDSNFPWTEGFIY
jgi:uncharacterized protein YndB with AHSA1/START domain